MKDLAMLKFTTAACLAITLVLGACGNTDTLETSKPTTQTAETELSLPPLADYMSCLPQKAALTAAHRGTAKNTKYPENSMSALNALLKKGYLVAEIDVAGLKDGVHILFHDGVWDDESTGKGPVASSTWKDAEKLLLKNTKRGLSADRPIKFEDYLIAAKGNIYLEIDFKSSSKYKTVINLIRKHNMADQVILISYNEGQTRKLIKLAPEMMISVSTNEALGQKRFKPNQVAAWVGYDLDNRNLMNNLRDKGVPVLGRIRRDWNLKDADAADILITDNIFDTRPIEGLNRKTKAELESCLAEL